MGLDLACPIYRLVVLIAFYERYAKPIQRFFAGSGFVKIVIAYMGGLLISDFVASLIDLRFVFSWLLKGISPYDNEWHKERSGLAFSDCSRNQRLF